MKHLSAVAFAAAVALSAQAHAGTSTAIFAYSPSGSQQLDVTTNLGVTVLNATAMGWYEQTGTTNGGGNYIAGICGSSDVCRGPDLNFHDYFVFDLSTITGTVLSASLSIGNGATPPGYINPAPSATYGSWDVTTPIADLGSVNGVGIFNDLGSGTLYASTTVSAADNGTQVAITLNAAALGAIQAAEGSSFAIGGSVASASAVPEPASIALLTAGALGLGLVRRRRI